MDNITAIEQDCCRLERTDILDCPDSQQKLSSICHFSNPVHNKVISGFQALHRARNPRQKGPCRSQGGLASHCATDASPTIPFTAVVILRLLALMVVSNWLLCISIKVTSGFQAPNQVRASLADSNTRRKPPRSSERAETESRQ
ncbi:hypothetical protein PoB_005639400 [Plakobranchus ocellatus]|uniref:Uncharacterized protein n=1 Tax=Plakobranchus ocellatus TaxID=259542 RepID=A0AAV4CFE7_9GAST|nr:hypothetical protein PoB_005639400 [Plakobranchus ocellatus]